MELKIGSDGSVTGDLSALVGQQASGTWILEIRDTKKRHTGTLNDWSLMIEFAAPSVPAEEESSPLFTTSTTDLPGSDDEEEDPGLLTLY